MAKHAHFSRELFKFLRELELNNDREWFNANKPRYLEQVRDPALQFVRDFAPRLYKISDRFLADPRPVGGSLFRIYRDTRFAKDKRPYKTHIGIQFRHEAGKDAHAPGFYLHLEPGSVFAAAGAWHPEREALANIRQNIADDPKAWKKAIGGKAFRERFELGGESLKRPPRGFDPEHPLVEDLKRKDFICHTELSEKDVYAAGFADEVAKAFRGCAPLVKFLSNAVGVSF